MSLSCTVSEILSLIFRNLKRSTDPEHIPFGAVCHSCTIVYLCVNQHTTFAMPIFADSKDMIGAKFKKMGHVNGVSLITPIMG